MSGREHITRAEVRRSLRMAGGVERYHTWPIRKPTVADSTWHVMRVYLQVFGSPPATVWEYVLLHDVAEMGTGDVPFDAKRRWPALKSAVDHAEQEHLVDVGLVLPTLTDVEWRRFKACDLLEMYEFASTELLMGNALAGPVIDATKAALAGMEQALGREDYRAVCNHMERRLP